MKKHGLLETAMHYLIIIIQFMFRMKWMRGQQFVFPLPSLHTVHTKHDWALGFLRMELVLLHSLMNVQPLHFPRKFTDQSE